MTKSPEFNANPPGVFLLGVGAQKAGTIAELKSFRQLNAKPLQPGTWVQPRTWLRQWFIHNPEHYAEYFQWLLKRPRLRGAQIQLTGDMPPPMPCSVPTPFGASTPVSRPEASP